MKRKFLNLILIALYAMSFAACTSAEPKPASYHPGNIVYTKLGETVLVMDTPYHNGFCGCGDHEYHVRPQGLYSIEDLKEIEIDHKIK